MTLHPRDDESGSPVEIPRPHHGDLGRSEPGEQLELISTSHHVGPLPPADDFEAYNRGTPDAADRILTMAEESLQLRVAQGHHQMAMERDEAALRREIELRDADRMDHIREDSAAEAEGDRRSLTRSQYLAGGIVALFVALAALAVVLGEAWVGAAFGGIAMAGVVTAFLNPRLFGRSAGHDDQDAIEGSGVEDDEPRPT